MKISYAPDRTAVARACLLGCAVLLSPLVATAQSTLQPAQRLPASAQHERWFVEGEPIPFWGSVYYPAGAAVFFNPFEMARSGNYRGVPLYSIKTREPYAVIYVPLPGGLVQPYERRREAGFAGTAGSVEPIAANPVPLGVLATALEPTGLNAFYVEYQGQRWFSSGPTVLLDPSAFKSVGDYHGFPVYVSGGQAAGTIYIPVAMDVKGLLTPYSTRE